MGFKKVIAHGNAIKAITNGSVKPSGLAQGQSAPTPQKFGMGGSDPVGVKYCNGGKIAPQRG
jgi:hypothetical protein